MPKVSVRRTRQDWVKADPVGVVVTVVPEDQVAGAAVPEDQAAAVVGPESRAAEDSKQIITIQFAVPTKGGVAFDPASLFESVKNQNPLKMYVECNLSFLHTLYC